MNNALVGSRRLLIGVAVAASFALPPAAAQAARTSVAIFSDPADYVAGGAQRLFTPANSTIAADGDKGFVNVAVNGGGHPGGSGFTLEFAPPTGHLLRSGGVYDYAQRATLRQGDHPGIDVIGDRSCTTVGGRFQVRDIALDADKHVERLWILYEQHCDGHVPGLFGEVRVGESRRAALPGIVRWPAGEHGSVGTRVPVTFTPGRDAHFGRAQLAGSDPAAFQIRADGCSGKDVAGGSSCRVWLRFRAGPGTHRAKLRLSTSDGRSFGAKLQGFDWGGKTRVTLHSEDGDYIGQGKDWTFTPRTADLEPVGSPQGIDYSIRAGADLWNGSFSAPPGDALDTRSYPNAGMHPDNVKRPGLYVRGQGRACDETDGSFSVHDLRFDPRDGSLHNFGASFVQHCDGAAAALSGELDFRAGDHTAPAPWIGRISP